MRLSRPDENDPTKRRHFEISIDSPFNILSCRATQANTSLPAYEAGMQTPGFSDEYDCGCPGAALRRRSSPSASSRQLSTLVTNLPTNSSSSTVNAIPGPQRSWTNDSAGLSLPSQVHVHGHQANSAPRPMHLLRAPSFSPPPFD